MSHAELQTIVRALRALECDPGWPLEAQFTVRRFNRDVEAERPSLERAEAFVAQGQAVPDELATALSAAAAQLGRERARIAARLIHLLAREGEAAPASHDPVLARIIEQSSPV